MDCIARDRQYFKSSRRNSASCVAILNYDKRHIRIMKIKDDDDDDLPIYSSCSWMSWKYWWYYWYYCICHVDRNLVTHVPEQSLGQFWYKSSISSISNVNHMVVGETLHNIRTWIMCSSLLLRVPEEEDVEGPAGAMGDDE